VSLWEIRLLRRIEGKGEVKFGEIVEGKSEDREGGVEVVSGKGDEEDVGIGTKLGEGKLTRTCGNGV